MRDAHGESADVDVPGGRPPRSAASRILSALGGVIVWTLACGMAAGADIDPGPVDVPDDVGLGERLALIAWLQDHHEAVDANDLAAMRRRYLALAHPGQAIAGRAADATSAATVAAAPDQIGTTAAAVAPGAPASRAELIDVLKRRHGIAADPSLSTAQLAALLASLDDQAAEADDPARIAARAAQDAQRGQAPWAAERGHDACGDWADLAFGGVTQRFRLIQPGTFTMGLDPDETQACDDHTNIGMLGPTPVSVRHQVTLTRAFWLADTPCTQALWIAVNGANPAYFHQDVQRPVEQVSSDDCVAMMAKLNRQVPGLKARLPTEAEWEYACRAGTATALYTGGITYTDDDHSHELDRIAWYIGDASDDGVPSHATTHPVKGKPANAWGLYDMLGNVRQWCADHFVEATSAAAQTDPQGLAGPGPGQVDIDRVLRGGAFDEIPARCHCGSRSNWTAFDASQKDAGFRICVTIDPDAANPADAPPDDATAAGVFTVRPTSPPHADWAGATGRDDAGAWADLRIKAVTQRFRWICPGVFTIGSPPGETGRHDGELQHQVTLTRGFWLADTPCTQALWDALLTKDPSTHTGDPRLPVDGASDPLCHALFAALGRAVPGLQARLPTVAEWEYACRAGDLSAFGGKLDDIAWYQGDCDGKSQPVAGKKPNPWGLYDMHGDIWQLCADDAVDPGNGLVAYAQSPAPVTDPLAPPTTGPGRFMVVKGGCAGSAPADCRAAVAGFAHAEACDPGNLIGLRLCISPP